MDFSSKIIDNAQIHKFDKTNIQYLQPQNTITMNTSNSKEITKQTYNILQAPGCMCDKGFTRNDYENISS